MNLLSAELLSKSYGDKKLFSEISFGIERGERCALIARNGSGKTTLLNILTGIDIPDSGKVTFRNDIRWSFLQQEPVFDETKTILQHLFDAGVANLDLISNYEMLLEEQSLKPNDASLQKALHEISARIDSVDAWNAETRVRQILGRLDIHDLNRKISELSGGQRKRIALGKVLIEEPDLLLMDEPTNHLDAEMVEWLEDYLLKSSCALLLVTHDRYFLDEVCHKIFELEGGTLYSYEGNYSYFLEKKSERELSQESEQGKIRNIYRRELEWIRRMPKARGTKSKSRVDAFKKTKENLSGYKLEEKLYLDVKMNRIGGKVLEMKKVYKSFEDLQILKGFDYTFKTGERIGIVGKNGVGKSTFVNLITNLEQPDSGKINIGETIVFGYYSQRGLELNEDKRVIEVVKEFADVITLADGTKVSASSLLELFQFSSGMQHTFVSKLSGGEKRRLHLLTVLIKNPNFLILDEPTNDLDLLTLNTLEEFLLNFKGCLIIISHDRYFMDKLVNHLFVFEGNAVVHDYNGTYSEFRLQKEFDEKKKSLESNSAKQKKESILPAGVKKAGYREKYEFETLEKEIGELELKKEELTVKLNSGAGTHQDLLLWAGEVQQTMELLDKKIMRWLELSEMM